MAEEDEANISVAQKNTARAILRCIGLGPFSL